VTRTGRRPGAPDTRATIVDAARRAFASRGYRAATFRAIADDAGVDPGLITHYFGTKDGLFAAALELPTHPSEVFAGIEALGASDAAKLLVGGYLSLLEVPGARDTLLALIRSAMVEERPATLLREFLVDEILSRIAATTEHPDAQLRAALVAAQLVGIAVLRYVVGVDALVAVDNSELTPLVAAAIERYLQ
jgi:AcrR family transcriptional regulator